MLKRFFVTAAAIGLSATIAPAQQTRPDSARADSLARLSAVTVTVTRADALVSKLPWAIGVQTGKDVRRGQATLATDEALNNVPGVDVSNRYIYALDPRISIRGAGSRANFGTRGIKVLLDGVPQSLPDGQSQLTNVELGTIGRVEVLRGGSSSLYGNGSGGVISFETDMRAPARLTQEARLTSGSYAQQLGDVSLGNGGFNKWQTRTVGRTGPVLGMLSISRTTVDGFRQYSAADVRQVNAAVDVAVRSSAVLQFRANAASIPLARNPGALTRAEWELNPDSAAKANTDRGASRIVAQHQYSLGYKWSGDNGTALHAIGWYLTRTIDNPLATPPPAPAGATNGTLNVIERGLGGGRVDATRALGSANAAPRLTAGVDLTRSRDHRRNWRTTGGVRTAATDTLLQDQDETVLSFGPFAQVSWAPTSSLLTSVGIRWDNLRFEVDDHFLADGDNDSGDRTMQAFSGHLGGSFNARPWLVPYAHIATSFETPTTTELNARSDGASGFNSDLDPQRSLTIEAGARGSLIRGRLSYDISLFSGHTDDAIIQYMEVAGRAYFRNAGETKATGAEIGLRGTLTSWLDAQLAYTSSHFVFDTYRVARVGAVDTLDGNRLAGVPNSYVRAGIRSHWRAATVDADWTWSDKMWADDINTLKIPDWGRGKLDTRIAWTGMIGGQRFEPFVGVSNIFNQQYIGSITLNGAFGRVRESAPGRNWYAGLELGWSILK